MRVRLTEPAANGIRRVADQIAFDDPGRAEEIADQFELQLKAIGRAPHLSAPVVRANVRAIRKKPMKPFLILYDIVGNEVRILRIAHERSDWASLI